MALVSLRRAAAAVLCALLGAPLAADEVNVYSARHYDTDMALYEHFEELTGIRVNLLEGGSDQLIARILAEGEQSPADLLITVDAGRLWRADEQGIFQPVDSMALKARVPAHLRHPDGHWYGLSKRARVIVHNTAAGLPEGIDDYLDLADPALRGRVCMRSSSNIYNLSLLASIIASHGSDVATDWARGVVANFARRPQGNDTAQLRAVAAGECGVTIANTYYLGRFLGTDADEAKALVDAITVVFPGQGGRGTHVNISGAGVTRHAPNRANAVAFLEYLAGDFAQRLFAEGNNEYPVSGPVTGPIRKLGRFEEDQLNANLLGEHQAEAVRIFDVAGWR